MKVVVVDPSGKKESYYFNNQKVVIGRSKNTDIIIKNNAISGQHIELEEESEAIKAKVLSTKSWVSYEKKKILPGMSFVCSASSEICLPTGHLLYVEPGLIFDVDLEDGTNLDSDKTKTFMKKVLSRTATRMLKLERKVTPSVSISLEEKAKPALTTRQSRTLEDEDQLEREFNFKWPILFGLIILCSFFIYNMFMNKNEVREIVKNVEATKETLVQEVKKVSSVKDGDYVQAKKNFKLLLDSDKKCHGKSLKKLCKYFLKDWEQNEGIIKVKDQLFVIVNLDHRTMDFLGPNLKLFNNALSFDEMKKVLVLSLVGKKKILRSLNKNKINKIQVYYFSVVKNHIHFKGQYSIETSGHKQIDSQERKKILNIVKEKLHFVLFKSRYGNIINEEMN